MLFDAIALPEVIEFNPGRQANEKQPRFAGAAFLSLVRLPIYSTTPTVTVACPSTVTLPSCSTTRASWPGWIAPASMASASTSSTCVWMARRNGRAPNSASKPSRHQVVAQVIAIGQAQILLGQPRRT